MTTTRPRHRTRWRPSRRLIVAMAALSAVAAWGLFPAAASASPPLPPGVQPIGQYSTQLPGPVTGTDKARDDAKQVKAAQFYAQASAHWATLTPAQRAAAPTVAVSRPSGAVIAPSAATAPTNLNLSVPYYAQANSYYCGPATALMDLNYLGAGFSSQSSAAYYLNTTSANGTGWYGVDNVPPYPGTSSYIMQDVFNWRLYQQAGNSTSGEWYTSVVIPASPTSAQDSTYKTDLLYDITSYYPEALNQYSSGRDNHLPYQPAGAWQHWLVGRGYSSSGAVTVVNDPGWSTGNNRSVTSIGGAGTIIYIFDGHGYTW